MSVYNCPLCEQEVSRSIYERITGVWKEKERRLEELKLKEKKIVEREKKLLDDLKEEKKKFIASERSKRARELSAQKLSYEQIINKEKEAVKREKLSVQKEFDRKLSVEINKMKKVEHAHKKETKEELKKQAEILKVQFEEKSKKIMFKENAKLQREKKQLEKKDRNQMNKYNRLNQQFSTMQKQSDRKIRSLEEQIKKNQTPQVLGLLEEHVFLDKLEKMFPKDDFEHTGKRGDIVHSIMLDGNKIGSIVYELKKVAKFDNKHIEQTLTAKQYRQADYGLLVTNAKRPKDEFGFLIEKGVIVIHPAGTLVLVKILRDHLVNVSRLKLSKKNRSRVVAEALRYIQGPQFKNSIESIIIHTKDLYSSLKKEVKGHMGIWEFRIQRYQLINSEMLGIQAKVGLFDANNEIKINPVRQSMVSIDFNPMKKSINLLKD